MCSSDLVVPTTVSGNYVLDVVGYYDDIDLTVTGDVMISAVSTFEGQQVRISSTGTMSIAIDMAVGSGTLDLSAATLSSSAKLTADNISIVAGSVSQPLRIAADAVSFTISGQGQGLTLTDDDTVTIRDSSMNSGALSVTAPGGITLQGNITGVASTTLTSTSAIQNTSDVRLEVSGLASFSGSSINLGTRAGDVLNFGSLAFTSSGSVTVVEDSATNLSGSSTAQSLSLSSGGSVTGTGVNLNVADAATVSGKSISLLAAAGDTLNVANNLTLSASGGGAISIGDRKSTRLNSSHT